MKKVNHEESDTFDQLHKSPIRGIVPVAEREIDINLIDTDPTNPGGDPHSKRYERRATPILESFHIIGRIVYPIVVCEDGGSRFTLIDGHGRFDEEKRQAIKKVRAIIFPEMNLEQRICLRQTLNAAQEPFDTPLILKDLQLLAKERGLDLKNKLDLESLIADMPVNIRKQKEKLKLLIRWPEPESYKIGVDDDDEKRVIGFDKLKELDQMVTAVQKNHPETANKFKGDELYGTALDLYFDKKFRGGSRSQDAIRDIRKSLKTLPQDHPSVKKLLNGQLTYAEFVDQAESVTPDSSDDIVTLCKELNSKLTDADPSTFTAADWRALKRTIDLASQVLSERNGVRV